MVTKSCASCVFNISAKTFRDISGEDLLGGVCSVENGPTHLPLASRRGNEQLEIDLANECGDWEQYQPDEALPLPSTSDVALHGVMAFERHPDANTLMHDRVPEHDRATSCIECPFYAAPAQMEALGHWPIATCTAKGILLQRNMLQREATTCNISRKGERIIERAEQLMLAEPYANYFTSIGTLPEPPIETETPVSIEVVDPTTYPTDREVTEADAELGIRAWRKVPDPNKSTRHAFLPVFNVEFFGESDQDSIPRTGDDEHPEEYVDHMGLTYKAAVLWMHLNETPALWGVAGTGKTEFYRYMAWLMCLPFNRISVTGSTEVEDLAGKMHYEPTRGTYFEYGRIPNAWQKPGVICLDEPNVGQPDVWQFVRPLTDNSKQLVLDMNNGERISRHPHAFLGMAMNPAWDVRNSGTATLADADGSRLMHIYVDLPNEETERGILAARVRLDGWEISKSQLNMVMGIAKDLREQSKNQTLSITWGIRPQIKVARALQWFTPIEAYRLATVDYLDPEQQDVILETVKSWAAKSAAERPAPGGKAKLKGSWESGAKDTSTREYSIGGMTETEMVHEVPKGLRLSTPEEKKKRARAEKLDKIEALGKSGVRLTEEHIRAYDKEELSRYTKGYEESDAYKEAAAKRERLLGMTTSATGMRMDSRYSKVLEEFLAAERRHGR